MFEIQPIELSIIYGDFYGDIWISTTTLYADLQMLSQFDKSTVNNYDCGESLVAFTAHSTIAQKCIKWIVGKELLNILNPICST